MLKSFYSAFLCLLISSFFLLEINAQDTITVQTITLDTDDRAGVFTFPDDPGQTYEKILMRYQIRCHDLAVGNGNVGCREWDYSCNTFITDSTRVDSLRAYHPNYVISNFSGTEYNYTQQPVFEYTQYEQTEVIYNNVLTETTAQVGTGSTAMNLAGDQTVARAQFLFTADELTAAGLVAGPVTSLRMDLTQLGDDINFMRIKLKHSTKTELLATDPDMDNFTEVYFLSTSFQNTGEHPFLFSNTFEWDGTSNVIVEFSFTNQNAGTPTGVNGHDSGFDSGIVTATADQALHFAGSGYIPVDATPLSAITNEMTVAFWSNGSADILPVNTTIFEGLDDNNVRQANVHLPWSNGQVYWDCGNLGSGYDRINAPADPSDFAGQWSHWAFTKNASTGNMTVYLNGEVFVSGTGKTNPIDITSFHFARSITNAFYYYGAIDELQIWNTALDQSTIQNWMRQGVNSSHPNYDNLLAYFQLNEGSGTALSDASINANTATISGASNWEQIRGKDLYKDFNATTIRPNINFVQGTYEQTVNTIYVLDSVPASQNQITAYEVVGTDLNEVNTFTAYMAGTHYIHNEMGEVVDSFDVAAENTLEVFDMEYYNKFPAKYEILSLVTPYGNGLDLGPDGKTFVFDVTDYAPILKGNRRLSIEMGGQNQTEMDIRFLYITGTPTRDVRNIQNIWPFRRGWFGSIQDDALFEPRSVSTDPDAAAYEIRSSITGHGQNGEFVERTHYLNINGGTIEYPYEVWKECGAIPIYPQGGTWIFDRAGWCPGDPTEVNRFDITEHVTPGQSVEIDYGLLGGNMSEANYLVSNQLVTYGSPNFGTDAAILDVIRPSLKVEHERFNPACNLPTIVLQNNGTNELTSATIQYQVQGGTMLTYEWTGNLGFLETETVELPVEYLSFWDTNGGDEIFEVSISNVNGDVDEYANNNTLRSAYATTSVLEGTLFIEYETNNRGEENEIYIRNYAGDIVLERTFMNDNTLYTDAMDFPPGCYSMEFLDDGGDGLEFWLWEQLGLNVGEGHLKVKKQNASGSLSTLKNIEPDFGSVTRFDFVIPQTVSTLEPGDKPTLMSIYPNPTADNVNVDLVGFENKELIVSLYSMTGQKLRQQILTKEDQKQVTLRFDVADLPAGIYQLEIVDGNRRKSGQVVVE